MASPARLTALGGSLAALLILVSPSLPQWGTRHTPHLHRPPVILRSGHAIGQTIILEHSPLDTVVLWVDTARPLPRTAALQLTVDAAGRARTTTRSLADVPPSGALFFPIQPALAAPPGTPGTLRVRLTGPGAEAVALQYQIASDIYPDGALFLDERERPGDLAFQLRYRRPALGSWPRTLFVASLLALAAVIVARALRRERPEAKAGGPFRARVGWTAAAAGLAVALFYGIHLLPPGIWVGPSDFTKDAAYLASAADALRSGAWPVWNHRTCGGMALLGNPEGNTVSLGTLFALFLPPDRALGLLLSVEAGLAAAGTVVLAAALGLPLPAALAAAAVASLSGALPYRIGEGLTPVGGAVAFLPWTVLAFLRALAGGPTRGYWALLAGTGAALMFLRGDVHVVVGVLLVLSLLAFVTALARRTLLPLAALAVTVATFGLWSSIKVLPYLEHPDLVQTALPPYVVPLTRAGLLDDALLKLHPRTLTVKPEHDRREESWGNVGAYVGTLPLLLGLLGALARTTPSRGLLLTGALGAFLLGEGALFDAVLRHLGPLASLLRMPSRLFGIVALFLGLLAAGGLNALWPAAGRSSPTPIQRGRRFLALALAAVVVLDLGAATRAIFRENLEWSPFPPRLAPTGPTLAPHAYHSPEDERDPSKLLRAGFLLPQICGDQNNPPAFLRAITADVPLASVRADLRANVIGLAAPAGPADLLVRTRFTTAWQAPDADLHEGPDGEVRVVVQSGPARRIELVAQSPTKGPVFILLATLTMTAVAAARRVRWIT